MFLPLLPMCANVFTGCNNKEEDKKEEEEKEPFVPKVYDLPCFYIETENAAPIVSKDDYINCSITINNTEEEYKLSSETGRIKGRGNSTWQRDKKPYKLKFDKRVPLFGNKKAKTWTLLANYYDPSLIKNYLAFSVGKLFDSQQYTSSLQFVDLYLNNYYRGVYAVCEQVEVDKNRIDIETPYEVGPTKMSYLIELDNWQRREEVQGKNVFVLNDNYYLIRYPDVDDPEYDAAHTTAVKEYFQSCFDALEAKDWTEVSRLMDVTSCADCYIIYEMFKDIDVGYSSFYMYIDRSEAVNGKLTFGPLWDFDRSAGFDGYSGAYIQSNKIFAGLKNIWFKKLLDFDEFKSLVKTELIEYKDKIISEIVSATSKVLNYPKSFEQNFMFWDYYIASPNEWKEWVTYTNTWLQDSINYIYNYYSSNKKIN